MKKGKQNIKFKCEWSPSEAYNPIQDVKDAIGKMEKDAIKPINLELEDIARIFRVPMHLLK